MFVYAGLLDVGSRIKWQFKEIHSGFMSCLPVDGFWIQHYHCDVCGKQLPACFGDNLEKVSQQRSAKHYSHYRLPPKVSHSPYTPMLKCQTLRSRTLEVVSSDHENSVTFSNDKGNNWQSKLGGSNFSEIWGEQLKRLPMRVKNINSCK